MRKITFLFGIHNHQPVGNFDSVIEEAYVKAYRPFLDVLERHPGMRVALHNSGILLDWFAAHHPDYLDRVGALVKAGRVEAITAGYYEPILPSIPDPDKVGQIRRMNDWIRQRWGVEPTGLWLTERVWEPSLVKPLAEAGVRYIMVDDAHFLAAGADPDSLWNWWLTEDQGATVGVWPISKRLRYLIPFEPPEKTIDYLRELAAGGVDRVALLADDGEKFGVWPDTWRQVYELGWLDRFFELLEANRDWLDLKLPGQVVASRPPEGRIYLPTASYSEMMEWALPTPVQVDFHRFFDRLDHGAAPEARFVRGGFWRNFLAKYPESNLMHKRMLAVRERINGGAGAAEHAAALDDVWQAQCNCAYWHGVFGGLYLPHLRDGLYRHILSAEARLDQAEHGDRPFLRVERADLDRDGREEIRLVNRELGLLVAPARGGAIESLDYFPRRRNLSHGLTRRPEAYHDALRAAAGGGDGGGGDDDGSVKSIHDRVEMKEPGLDRKLFYDWYRRLSLIDHFLRDETVFEDFDEADYGEQGDFVEGVYEPAVKQSEREASLTLTRQGQVWVRGEAVPVAVRKTLRMANDGARLTVDYSVTPGGGAPAPLWFGVEFNFTLLAGQAHDRWVTIDGRPAEPEPWFAGRGESHGARAIAWHDDWEKMSLNLAWDRPADLWRMPVETISQSESGFERVYQSSCALPHWRIELAPGQVWRVSFTLELTSRD